MILITEHAYTELVKTLSECQRFGGIDTGLYLHFKLAGKEFTGFTTRGVHTVILDATKAHLDTASPVAYVCDDGDIYITLLSLPRKYIHAMLQDVSARLGIIADENFALFDELETVGPHLLAELQLYIEKRRMAVATLKLQHEEDKQRLYQQTVIDLRHLDTKAH